MKPPFFILLLATTGMLPLPAGAAGGEILWHEWNISTFEKARREEKMIFVDAGIEGCTACRRMARVTFADREVIRLLSRHFISIAVDAEARPDLGERYADWTWPALIFMAPDATQVLAIAGNRLPRSSAPRLRRCEETRGEGERPRFLVQFLFFIRPKST